MVVVVKKQFEQSKIILFQSYFL